MILKNMAQLEVLHAIAAFREPQPASLAYILVDCGSAAKGDDAPQLERLYTVPKNPLTALPINISRLTILDRLEKGPFCSLCLLITIKQQEQLD